MEDMKIKIEKHVRNELNLFIEQLKELKIKVTLERRIILELFLKESNKHFSAKEIFQYSHDKNINLGLATIYRNLKLFESLNIISAVILQDRIIRYGFNKIKDRNQTLHFHMICMTCGEIIDYSYEEMSKLYSKIGKHTKFKVENIKGEFHGYCKKCMDKNKIRECG